MLIFVYGAMHFGYCPRARVMNSIAKQICMRLPIIRTSGQLAIALTLALSGCEQPRHDASSGGAAGIGNSDFKLVAGYISEPGYQDGQGADARFDWPTDISEDAQGNFYITDSRNYVIRKITPQGVVSTLAGKSGVAGSADGQGANARFQGPMGIAVDREGWLYVADTWDETIRKISPAGMVTTVAGGHKQQGSVDGKGTHARFSSPIALAIDTDGYIYIADNGSDIIRKMTPEGTVSTIAGVADIRDSIDGDRVTARLFQPSSIALDGEGNLYVLESGQGFMASIRRITPGGTTSTLVYKNNELGWDDKKLYTPVRFANAKGIAVDATRRLYVSDEMLHVIGPDGSHHTYPRTKLNLINDFGMEITAHTQGIFVDGDAVVITALNAVFKSKLPVPLLRVHGA